MKKTQLKALATNMALQKHLCHQGQSKGSRLHSSIYPPQHFLNFFPLPHGHGSFRPTFCLLVVTCGEDTRRRTATFGSSLSDSSLILAQDIVA